MIRFGVVGTNWITDEFIRCASLVPDFSLRAVYSRWEEKAKEFALKHSAPHTFSDLEEMAKSAVLDAVYIASPNSLHASQSILFMNNKKHVLCEKPMASNLRELKAMICAAQENNVLLMEAMKTTLLPNYQAIKENLPRIGKIRSSYFHFCQYSARYDLYKQGEIPNVFRPDFSCGSLMDIGVYGVYPVIDLFGAPEEVCARGVLLDSGVDGSGAVTLKYKDMVSVIQHSKITNSTSPSEIQGEAGSIVLDKLSKPRRVEIHYLTGAREDISRDDGSDAMYHEALEFIDLIKSGKTESGTNTFELAEKVMRVLDEGRRQMGVVFPADL